MSEYLLLITESSSDFVMNTTLNTRVEHRIKYTITEEFQIPKHLLNSETIFKEDLGFDDADMLFLSLALEDEFEFLLTEELQVKEMKDLVKLVVKQLRDNRHLVN